MKWFQALEALYGVDLKDAQIDVWDEFLIEENASGDELCSAIRMAAKEGMRPVEWRVTVRDVIKWLKIYRARKHAESNKEERAEKIRSLISEWKEKISRGTKKDDFLSSLNEVRWLTTHDYNEICREVLK